MYHKEENSVLFSLSHLQTLATASGLGGSSPNAPGDATKMIDIRRLSPALDSNNVATVSPTLLMGSSQTVNVRNWIIPLCIGFGTLIICIAILSLALIYNEPEGGQVRLASVAAVDEPLTAEPVKPSPVVSQLQKKEALASQAAPKTAKKPLRSVNDLIVKKRTSSPAKAHQRASKKKIRAYRKWKKRRAARLKRRRARRKRAKAAKRRRKKRTRLARAKLARRDRTTRSTKRRGPSKHSELDDLLTGL